MKVPYKPYGKHCDRCIPLGIFWHDDRWWELQLHKDSYDINSRPSEYDYLLAKKSPSTNKNICLRSLHSLDELSPPLRATYDRAKIKGLLSPDLIARLEGP